MTPTTTQLETAAKKCGMEVCESETFPGTKLVYGQGNYEPIDWLLTPDGREAMEKAVLAKGLWLEQYAFTRDAELLVKVRINDGGRELATAQADSPAAALVLAICELEAKS